MRTAVVTGASTGIGYATARVLTSRGSRVFGSVRRSEDAERVARELGSLFVPLRFDVTDPAAVRAGAAQVARALERRPASRLEAANVNVPAPKDRPTSNAIADVQHRALAARPIAGGPHLPMPRRR
jgi:NAD(P)-dependent dehydrogenase (short-subunit alcohol dehydrogenase family)